MDGRDLPANNVTHDNNCSIIVEIWGDASGEKDNYPGIPAGDILLPDVG